MIQELLYTSAPKGLKPGSRGFCTVLSTSGMPAPVATALESLSGYRPVFPPGDPQAAQNPVVYSHLKMSLGGRRGDVLSRIADYGLDYSQRTNKIAHHLVVDPSDRPAAGPAWLLAHPDVMRANWNGEPRIVAGERSLPQGKSPLRPCSAWKELAGDAGWAGVLAESFLSKPDNPAYIVFSPGMNLLPLIEEALALLPTSRRWDVTFSTYFTKIPNGVTCNWRCVLADSPEAKESRRYVQSLRIDLTQPLGTATGGELVEAARSGRMPASSIQETAIPGIPESMTSHQEMPSKAGIAPPVRTRDGRPIPNPRKRLSEFPVGYSDVLRQKEPSRSWTKWVISLLVLILIGVGTLAVKQGWVPLNGKYLLVADNAVPPPVKEAAPKSPPEKPQGETIPEQVKEPLPAISMTENTMAKGGPPSEAAPPSTASSVGEADKPKEMSHAEKPAAQGAGAADTTTSETKTPTPQKGEQTSRNLELHWGALPDQLKVNEPYEIDLPEWINPKDSVVTIWCPSDTIKTIQGKKHIAQVYDQTEDQLQDAITATVETKNGTSSATLRLKSAKPMIFSDFCRIVVNVSNGNNKDQLNVLLHETARLPPTTLVPQINSISLLAPLSWPNESNWRTRVDALVYSETKAPALDKKTKHHLTVNSGILSTVFDVECASISDLSTIKNSPFESLQALPQTPVKHKIQLSRNPARTGNKNLFEVLIFVDHDEFEKSLKQQIEGKIGQSDTNPAILGIGARFPSVPKTITSDQFIKEVESYRSHVSNKVAKEEPEINKLKEAAKTQEQRMEAGNKTQSLESVRKELERASEILEYCKAAQVLVKKLKDRQIEELRISQECKNGEKTEYLPIIVYHREASTESATSK